MSCRCSPPYIHDIFWLCLLRMLLLRGISCTTLTKVNDCLDVLLYSASYTSACWLLVAWLSGNVFVLCSYSTLARVSTWMGERGGVVNHLDMSPRSAQPSTLHKTVKCVFGVGQSNHRLHCVALL